jgi:hypothetical protein
LLNQPLQVFGRILQDRNPVDRIVGLARVVVQESHHVQVVVFVLADGPLGNHPGFPGAVHHDVDLFTLLAPPLEVDDLDQDAEGAMLSMERQ